MKKAIIVGGSMGGMLAGNILIRQGWAVEILERTEGDSRRAEPELCLSVPCLVSLDALA